MRTRLRGQEQTLSAFVRAKLQPARPTPDSWATRCGIKVTARDYRVILAQGAPEQPSVNQLLTDYDRAVRPHQRLLASMLTIREAANVPAHRLMSAAVSFATLRLSHQRNLTSLVILHTPSDELTDTSVHAHIVILARVHRQAGFAQIHPMMSDQAHAMWAEEWRTFSDAWANLAST